MRSYLAREEPASERALFDGGEDQVSHRGGGLADSAPAARDHRGVSATVTGVAAIHAELADTTGETHGVVGISNSGAGAMTLRVDGVDVVTTATDADTLAALSCAADEIAKWNGADWACSIRCTATCPAGSVVWTGGCAANTFDSLTDNTPTESGGLPTGWRCEAWDPLGSATVNGELYCVVR